MEGLERVGVTSPGASLRRVLRGHERIAVTGATGWLGATALDLLDNALGPDAAERSVWAYASRPRTILTTSGRVVAVRPLIELPAQSPPPTHILHFSFLTRDRLSDLSVAEYAAANLDITATLLDAIEKHRPRGLVVASSGAVYGAEGRLETDLAGDTYGTLKHLDELAFRMAGRDVGAAVVIPRIFSLAGARMTKPEHYALGSLIAMALSTGQLKVQAPGPVVRTYADVSDVVALSLWLALTGRDAVFDTGGEPVEIGDLAVAVAAAHGYGPEVVTRNVDDSHGDRYVGDPDDWDRLLAAADITARPLASLIRDTSAWMRRVDGRPVDLKVGTAEQLP